MTKTVFLISALLFAGGAAWSAFWLGRRYANIEETTLVGAFLSNTRGNANAGHAANEFMKARFYVLVASLPASYAEGLYVDYGPVDTAPLKHITVDKSLPDLEQIQEQAKSNSRR
jgi:hypothetical protein